MQRRPDVILPVRLSFNFFLDEFSIPLHNLFIHAELSMSALLKPHDLRYLLHPTSATIW
jgi:hypothetical protein